MSILQNYAGNFQNQAELENSDRTNKSRSALTTTINTSQLYSLDVRLNLLQNEQRQIKQNFDAFQEIHGEF